jgi:hypothetical protein
MDILRSYNSPVNDFLSPLDSPPVAAFLRLFLILYGGMVAPHLPDSILKWFHYVPFRIFVMFLIVWTSSHDPSLGVIVSVAFFTSLNVLAGRKAFESFQQVQYY